jgi:hypothetical protein
MNKLKPYLVTIGLAVLAIALVFRVLPPKARQMIVGA